MASENPTTAKPVYCPRRQQHAAVCETPNACAGGVDCRLGPDLNEYMNDRPSVSNTTGMVRAQVNRHAMELARDLRSFVTDAGQYLSNRMRHELIETAKDLEGLADE